MARLLTLGILFSTVVRAVVVNKLNPFSHQFLQHHLVFFHHLLHHLSTPDFKLTKPGFLAKSDVSTSVAFLNLIFQRLPPLHIYFCHKVAFGV